MRTLLASTALAAAVMSLPACNDDVSQTNAAAVAAKPALTSVRLNFLPNMTYAPYMIAKDEGFFEEEGIDAELVSLDLNSLMLAATSGKLDVISFPVTAGIFNMMHRGAALQIVADKGHSEPGGCAAEAFAAPVATAQRIKSRQSLRGEHFMIRRAGMTEYLIDRFLQQNGLTQSDVAFAQIPHSQYVSAMQQQVDAIIHTHEPALSNLLSQGLIEVVATTEQINPGHQYSVVAFGERLLRDDPDLGRRFMRAYLRGVRQYNQGKTDRNIGILARHTKLTPEILRRACWIPIARDGRIKPGSLDDYFKWARGKGYLDAEVPASVWWNPSYIEAAESHGTVAASAPAR